jgi:hypothetical protein
MGGRLTGCALDDAPIKRAPMRVWSALFRT